MSGLVISAVLQVGFVVVLGFGFFAIRHRRVRGFWEWLGCKRAPWLALVLGAASIGAFKLVGPLMEIASRVFVDQATQDRFARSDNVNANMFRGLGLSRAGLVVAALVKSLFQTALSEEIFFRGLIGKRLGNRFGFHVGNGVQAALFGLMHATFPFLVLPPGPSRVGYASFLLLLTGGLGWWWGWLNERVGRGSILPSWLCHGVGNAIGYAQAALG